MTCTTTVVDPSLSAFAYHSMDLGYDAKGKVHVVYLSDGSTIGHATRQAGAWTTARTTLPGGADSVALSMVDGAPRIAAENGSAAATLYDVDATSGALSATLTLPGTPGAAVEVLRSGVDASGGYHVVALLRVRSSGAMVLQHLKPGHTTWEVTAVSTTPFLKASAAVAGDASADVVWNDQAGVLWRYNDVTGATTKLSETLGTTDGLAVVANGAAAGPTVLFASSTAWQSFDAGTTASVAKGAGLGTPAVIRAGANLIGAVYESQGATSARALLVVSKGSVWSTVTDVDRTNDAVVAVHGAGLPSMLVRRSYPSPRNNDVALVQCD